MKRFIFSITIVLLFFCRLLSQSWPIDKWAYIQIDSTRQNIGSLSKTWLRAFGIAFGDVNGDGNKDIASGRYIHINPGGDLTEPWQRIDLNLDLDVVLAVNVDDDSYADFIAMQYPSVLWLESANSVGTEWDMTHIGYLEPTGHQNGQGYVLADLVKGGKPEIVLACGDGTHYFEIPEDPLSGLWPNIHIIQDKEVMDEGIGVGYIDGDGDIDVVVGKGLEGSDEFQLNWYENPGDGSEDWQGKLLSRETNIPDRIVVADLNDDSRMDVAVAEERYPGLEPNADLYWFENPESLESGPWTRHSLLTTWSLNNLDTGDLDGDGDMELVTNEHKGSDHPTYVFENDGGGNFTKHTIDTGKEMHLGARLCDLDDDGDLDIAGTGWDFQYYMHVWRNDATSNVAAVKWQHKTSMDYGGIPRAGVGFQASAIVFDVDKDDTDDIIIAGWGHPSMIWLRPQGETWQRYIVDDQHSHVEAGGTFCDIDDDGDLDILQGGSWNTNEVWWWENPYPDYSQYKPWKRYHIKNYGDKQHHDQIFGDFDGDGEPELVFWNQYARKLLIADIPENPKNTDAWKLQEMWTWPEAFKYEGFAKGDVDGDGIIDLIGGGMWFKHLENFTFEPEYVDESYGSSRSAVGDFIKGGRPEIVLSSGDNVGPLNIYNWDGSNWKKRTLIDVLKHGHTLEVTDFNGDGHPDIYTAEMHSPGAGSEAKQWLLYGDGKGNFVKQILSVGIGTHEGKIGDLDGDGDVDILQKDFMFQRRIDVWLNLSK